MNLLNYLYTPCYKGEFCCLYSHPLSSWVPWLSSHPQLLVSVICTWALTLSSLIAFAFYFITTMKVPVLNSRLILPFTETKTKTKMKTKKKTSRKCVYMRMIYEDVNITHCRSWVEHYHCILFSFSASKIFVHSKENINFNSFPNHQTMPNVLCLLCTVLIFF